MKIRLINKNRGKRIALLTGTYLLLSFLSLSASQQEFPSEHHKITVRLKLLDVIVNDRNGNFVPGLTAGDFEVHEDGWLRPVHSVELITAESRKQLLTEVPAARIEEEIKQRRRLWVIFDCLNTEAVHMRRAVAGLMDVLNELASDGYELKIVKFDYDKGLEILTDFTSDRAIITPALRAIEGSLQASFLRRAESGEWKKTPETPGLIEMETGPESQLERLQWRNLLQKTLSCLLTSIQMIRETPGRKPILLISSGLPERESNPYFERASIKNLKFFDPFKIMKSDEYSEILGEIINLANTDQISFYCYNPAEIAGTRSNFALSSLAEKTGGLEFRGEQDSRTLVENINKEIGLYYEVAYIPASKEEDGKFHRVEVKVKREGLTVRTRAGYTEYDGKERDRIELAASFFSPEFYKALDFNLKLAAWPERKNIYRIWGMVRIPLTRLKEDGKAGHRINFLFGVKEINGERVHLGQHSLDLKEEFEAGKSYLDYHFVTTTIKIKPGLYEIAAVLKGEGGKTGAKKVWLQLPDLRQERGGQLISLITGRLLPGGKQGKPHTFDRGGLLNLSQSVFIPWSAEEISSDFPLAVFIQVYEAGQKTIKPEFYLVAGGKKFKLEARLEEEFFTRQTGCRSMVYVCSLKGIPSGEYQLVVEGSETFGTRAETYVVLKIRDTI